MGKYVVIVGILCGILGSTPQLLANDADNSIFLPPTQNPASIPENGYAGPIHVTGFRKIPADEALNQISADLQVAGFEGRSSTSNGSYYKNIYLAFAVDARYLRECYGSKYSSLCTFFHSSVRFTGAMSWSDDKSNDRYEVLLVPIEYVTGSFGKEGPDLKSTSGAMFATIGVRAEYIRDLGLALEDAVTLQVSASLNYSSPDQPLGPDMGFRWIGSVRVFGGATAIQPEQSQISQGAGGGIETLMGIVLDLKHGSVSFAYTAQLEGSVGLDKENTRVAMNSDEIELKYLRQVCGQRGKDQCKGPRKFSYGGGVRYEHVNASYEGAALQQGIQSIDRGVHRLLLFAEIARF